MKLLNEDTEIVKPPIDEIRRVIDLALQRDEFRATDDLKVCVVERWLDMIDRLNASKANCNLDKRNQGHG